MGKMLILLTYLGSLHTDPNYIAAADVSRRAIMAYPSVQQEMREVEDGSVRLIKEKTGLTPDELMYAAYMYPLFFSKITTKPFKNLQITLVRGLTLRPEIEYSWKENQREHSAFLILTKEL